MEAIRLICFVDKLTYFCTVVISDEYLEPSRTYTMELFCKNSWQLKVARLSVSEAGGSGHYGPNNFLLGITLVTTYVVCCAIWYHSYKLNAKHINMFTTFIHLTSPKKIIGNRTKKLLVFKNFGRSEMLMIQ